MNEKKQAPKSTIEFYDSLNIKVVRSNLGDLLRLCTGISALDVVPELLNEGFYHDVVIAVEQRRQRYQLPSENFTEPTLLVRSGNLRFYLNATMFQDLRLMVADCNLLTGDDGEQILWLAIDYRWTHFGGGSNGCKILTIGLREDGSIKNYENHLKEVPSAYSRAQI